MKINFYFTLKALFVVKILKLLSWLFGYVERQLDQIAKVNFKIYDVTDWTGNSYNTNIAQCLSNEGQSGNEIWSVKKI